MAEQAASAVASVVIGEVTDMAITRVMRKLRSRSRPAATDEKLQRLETLVLKLRCAVEVSEKHAIGSASLLQWRDRLREAAAEAGAVVLDFQRRAREEDGEAASTSASGACQQQQRPAAAGGAIAPTSTLYFTRSVLSGMAQRVRDVTRRLFSTDEDMHKLDSALEKMERLSPDITQFLMALQLEVSPELGRRPAKRSAPEASIPAERRVKIKESTTEATPVSSEESPPALFFSVQRNHRATPMDPEQREARMLAMKLDRRLRRMVRYIKATDGRDMVGLEWLAEWGALLREAVERGNVVLQTLRPGSDAIQEQAGSGALEEDGELYSFARAVERLVLDEPFWWTYALELIKRKKKFACSLAPTKSPCRPSADEGHGQSWCS